LRGGLPCPGLTNIKNEEIVSLNVLVSSKKAATLLRNFCCDRDAPRPSKETRVAAKPIQRRSGSPSWNRTKVSLPNYFISSAPDLRVLLLCSLLLEKIDKRKKSLLESGVGNSVLPVLNDDGFQNRGADPHFHRRQIKLVDST
jgi:hypothetical protein